MAEKDDIWDLGEPRAKKYMKPDFSGHTIDTSEITDDSAGETGNVTAPEIIPQRGSSSGSANNGTVSSSFWIDPIGGGRVVTSSYRRHSHRSGNVSAQNTLRRREPGRIVSSYVPDGTLIKKTDVRTWETDTEFYGRFASDALQSFRTASRYGIDDNPEPVEFFSYVPQYAHMNMRQLEYYRWVRESIRYGRHPECALSYLLLMIYEILNLPDEIRPEEGAELLAEIWTGYRDEYVRLDAYLCEWLADYCMIHGLRLPKKVFPILPKITPKAQFKEFYIDPVMNGDDGILGDIVAESASDYDYRSSRYYEDNSGLFDQHISAAIGKAVRDSLNADGIFSLDRTYTMTRDSYCGAIVSSGLKRRIDIEFCSFTRRADVRHAATMLVKYCENNVRAIAGIKARLNVDDVDAGLKASVDRYFLAFLPERARPKEDRFMPADYMKNYEAEDSGFDIDRAAEIEQHSWTNTERLTGEEFTVHADDETGLPVEGEIVFAADETVNGYSDETAGPVGEDREVVSGILAALDGTYSSYCRQKGIFEGELADRINNVMLDYLGDIGLENDGTTYVIIEDYRKEIEQWVQENT